MAKESFASIKLHYSSKPFLTKPKTYYDYEEKQHEDEERAIGEFLDKCTKTELENIIWQMLSDGFEWQYESFVRNYLDLDQ